jgi:hypothetical protein
MIDVIDNAVVEEPVVEPATDFVEEPAAEPIDGAEPSSAASEEPVVEAEPVVVEEPVVEPEVEPVVVTEPEPETDPAPVVEEPVPVEPTVEQQFAELQATHEALQASFSALEAAHNDLQTRFNELETAHAELVEFKRQSDDAKKDEMIGRFYMLNDEDKKDIIDHKANYTVEEIEEKLSVICFRKKVNFELEDNSKNDNKTEQPAVTFNLSTLGSSKPGWLTAVDNAKNY